MTADVHHITDPAVRAQKLNEMCVQMVKRHEKPLVIQPVREAYLQAVKQTERLAKIVRVTVPQVAVPPRMMTVEDEVST